MNAEQLRALVAQLGEDDYFSNLQRGYISNANRFNQDETKRLRRERIEDVDRMHGQGLETLGYASGLQDKRNMYDAEFEGLGAGLQNAYGREKMAVEAAMKAPDALAKFEDDAGRRMFGGVQFLRGIV